MLCLKVGWSIRIMFDDKICLTFYSISKLKMFNIIQNIVNQACQGILEFLKY